MFSIGHYSIASRVLLAPMAGVTDSPYRQLCRQFGAGLATTEMVTSDVNLWNSRKSRQRLNFASEIAPLSVQIAGSDPAMMAAAAQENVARGAQIIDINMGCPAKKVCKRAAGSALLKDEPLVAEILKSVVNAVSVPVTLKIRTGWSREQRNGATIAKMAEDSGITALAVHGRTRECRYGDPVDYGAIERIVASIDIPVIANGDITTPEIAAEVLNSTGAAAIMIGRGALGRPWIFQQIHDYLDCGTSSATPSAKHIFAIMQGHLDQLHTFYGDYLGVRIARKHVGWYFQNLPDTEKHRKHFNQITDAQGQKNYLESMFERLTTKEDKAA